MSARLKDPTLIEIAYHEAGHAVVAWRKGAEPIELTIEPGENYLGRLTRRDSLSDRGLDFKRRDEARDVMAMFSCAIGLAGPAGEREYWAKRGRDLPPPWKDRRLRDSQDHHHALSLAFAATIKAEREHHSPLLAKVSRLQAVRDYLEHAFIDAEAIVRRDWLYVNALAKTLVRDKTMSGAEILATFARVDEDRRDPE